MRAAADHGGAPISTGGDILFLTEQVPLSAERGRPARSYQMLRWLARHRRIHLVSLARDMRHVNGHRMLKDLTRSRSIFWHTEMSAAAAARALLVGRPMAFASARNDELRQTLGSILVQRRIATIFAASPAIAQHLPASALARTVVDFADADAPTAFHHGNRPLGRWLAEHERRLVMRAERKLMRSVKAGLFTDAERATLFDDLAAAGRRYVVRDGIDLEFFDPAVSFKQVKQGISIVFAAPMDVAANEEAAIWFADHILPALRQRHGDVGFYIVGARPSPAVRELRLTHEGVQVVGAVRDVRSWLAGASIVVVPLRRPDPGSSTLFEAMSMARPVVATPAAVLGVDAGDAIRIADGPDMIDAIDVLIADAALSAGLGVAAREHVARFSWENRLAPLASEFGLPG